MSSCCLGIVFFAYDTVDSCSNLFNDHGRMRLLTCESLEERDMLPRGHQLSTSIPFSSSVGHLCRLQIF